MPTDSLSQPDLRTPWRNAVNWSILKNNHIGERLNVQIRGEFYNVLDEYGVIVGTDGAPWTIDSGQNAIVLDRVERERHR